MTAKRASRKQTGKGRSAGGAKPAAKRSVRKRAPAPPAAARSGAAPKHSFPIAGIGASAGGLEAFTRLLEPLPPDTGMAFVLVQHLAPEHQSMLPEILARHTRMPVVQVTHRMRVAPDHVFVIPPNASMELSGGSFTLAPRDRSGQPALPIDCFFHSLADLKKSAAIGVVLSGNASDGTLGLQAIKGEGGITFAQEESSAKFPGMPRAAIASGAVDFVLKPEEIARELTRIARHPHIALPAKDTTEPHLTEKPDAAAVRKLFSLVRDATGVDFSYYRQSTILRRVSRRMAVHNIAGLTAYVRFLEKTPAEAVALYEDALIHVTSFFRDPETFEYLKKKIFPKLVKKRQPGLPVKVWVPGCATGEEVYSIAIGLFESLPSPAIVPIQIFASDLSDSAIEHARAGIYMENALAHVSEERRRRFFVKHDGGWQVTKAIRDVCIFARQNVATDPPFSNLDLLSCRNLLIYLDTLLQKRILPLFHHALKPTGYLMLGSAETVAGFSDLFAPVDRRHKIFFKKQTALTRPLNLAAGRFGSPTASPSPARPRRHTETEGRALAPDLARETDSLLLARYAPAGVVVNSRMEVVHFRGRTGAYLEAAPGKASLNILQMAREGLLADLRAAMHRARSGEARVRKERIRVKENGSHRLVNIEVFPLRATSEAGRLYLVTFEDAAAVEPRDSKTRFSKSIATGTARPGKAGRETERLEQELASTKEYLQAIIQEQEAANEELQSANEEILSSNEELQSTNEELDTAKEELQSTNEELTTLNEELQNRSVEIARALDDLSNLIAGVALPIVVVGPEGKIRRFTAAAEKLFNLVPADIGRPIRDIRPNFQSPDLPALVTNVIETITLQEQEIRDREGRWHLLRVRPYRTLDNRIDGAVIVLLDINEAKKGQIEAAAARDLSEAIVETARDAMLVLNPDLSVRSANQSFYKMFGASPGETEGRLVYHLGNHQWDIPGLRRLLEEIVPRDIAVQDFEVEHAFENLGPRSMVLNARQTTLAGETTGLILLAIQDVTERRFQERQAQSFAEARYRNLFESASAGILIADGATGEILEVNRYLTKLLGSAREESLGKKVWQLPFLSDSESMRLSFVELTENGFSYDPDVVCTTSSGDTVHMEAVGNVYLTGMKKFAQLNLRDTTARRKLEQELRQSQKLESFGQLAGGVAHDFNNLLNIISSYTELLAHGHGDPKKRENIEAVQIAVQRGAGLVRQLLNFARRDQMPAEAVDLNTITEEVARVLRETFPKKISVRLELEPTLPSIHADHNQLYQAILNLCVNARDAMPGGGTLTLSTGIAEREDLGRRFPEATAQRYVSVRVADTGAGMSEETRGRIFEPFFTTKERGGGSGLGLAVVHGVMRSHRGLLNVESERGTGTTFGLFFPALASRETPAAKSAETSPVRGGTETLLLLEDEELLASAIRSLLEEEGYRVLTAKDGQEGVEIYRERAAEIALVIADLDLPRLSGAEAYSKMKELNPEIAALVATGFLDPPLQRQLVQAGVIGFLRKPYSSRDILRKVRETLDARAAKARPIGRGPGKRHSKRA